jgi:hypothetical protein
MIQPDFCVRKDAVKRSLRHYNQQISFISSRAHAFSGLTLYMSLFMLSMGKYWSARRDLNPGQTDSKSDFITIRINHISSFSLDRYMGYTVFFFPVASFTIHFLPQKRWDNSGT